MKKDAETRYQELMAKLAKIGPICPGTINEVYKTCGRDYCSCMTDHNSRHGPYFVWTRKRKGKTVSRHLNKKQVCRCRNFKKNYEQFIRIYEELIEVAAEILLKK